MENLKPAVAPAPVKLLNLLGSAQFAAKKFPREWLVESVLVAGRPAVIGGPMKSFKTMLAVDLAVSLAAAKPFLGHFRVPKSRRVAVFSGESDPSELQDRASRVAAARGASLQDDIPVLWSCSLPNLGHSTGQASLAATLKHHQVGVVVLDPLYLALSGGRQLSPENVYEMGGLIRQVCDACLRVNATPVLVHHMNKSVAKTRKEGAPHLADLAYAGIAEYVRQWLLLGTVEPYDPARGTATIQMCVGGSAGHSGRWDLSVSEGRLTAALGRRAWNVGVSAHDGD